MNSAAMLVTGKVLASMILVAPPGKDIDATLALRKTYRSVIVADPSALRAASIGPGTGRRKMYFSRAGMPSKALSGTPKFFASTSRGIWAKSSVTSSVWFSEKLPSLKTRTNSVPPSSPWIACGKPAGASHRSPGSRSSTRVSRLSSTR